MKHTLIHAGPSVNDPFLFNVVIGTDLGEFSGTVRCREEDQNNVSTYFGLELAEMKAEIAYLRAKKRDLKAQRKALVDFWYDMFNTRTYAGSAFWVKKIGLRTTELDNQIAATSKAIGAMKEAYHQKIVTRDASLQKIGKYMKRGLEE
jgi:hypothetical protein